MIFVFRKIVNNPLKIGTCIIYEFKDFLLILRLLIYEKSYILRELDSSIVNISNSLKNNKIILKI